ncbi:MAG TPA: MFS transporter [Actinomycetes bacterium]|nr:MFS transporter [Actinomycetes bacterium]
MSRPERLAGLGRGAARATRSGAMHTARRVRRATHAHGAGESGLGRLIELHGVNTAGDAMVAVALANTLFFSVPTGEARGRVALYLLITMAPFAVMAPVVGPLLDRFRHGRRYAIAATMLARGFATWVLAGAIAGNDLSLYPAAFACLVASKAYGVTRSATVPRLLPQGYTLVAANARISLAGILSGAVGAGLAGLLAIAGPAWPLRLSFVVFLVGMVLALRLPPKVDSTAGETPTTLSLDDTGPIIRKTSVGPAVVAALRANGGVRAFSGFLTMFLAFLLREHPVGDLDDTVAFGLVAGAAAVGSFTGTTIGSRLRTRAPELVIVVVLTILTVAAAAGALFYGVVSVVAVALAAGLAQSLGKLSLDAVVQRDVPEAVRTSAFARSETLLQLSWVVGGGVGIVLPLNGALGLGLAALGLVVMLVLTVRAVRALPPTRSTRSARTTGPAPS